MLFPKPTKKPKAEKRYLVRRTPLRKRSKSPLKKAKDKAWSAFSRFIRMRDALKTTGGRTTSECYTCLKFYPISGKGCIQAGHFIQGRDNIVLFDERQVHTQCYMCNIVLGGKWRAYYIRMVEEYGQDEVDLMIHAKWTDVKLNEMDYLRIEEEYLIKIRTL